MGIVVIGAVFVDIKGYPLSTYIPGGRNAGRVEQVHGGVSRNVAEDIANVELRPTFVSLVDDTGSGQDVIDKLGKHKVNTRFIRRVHDGMGTWLAVFDNDGDVTAAIRLYETMLRRGDDPVSACEALAKLYEHRLHNPAQALTYTRQALLLLSEPGLFRSEAVQARQVALQYRYARLRRKLCAPCATSTKKEEPSSWES